ncbi:TetR family transcriptional regulator [Pseudonocardia sp. HH130630-07]|nr:TetR family transcriptional regulator [Pseudonocardia sp. HH130630-07]
MELFGEDPTARLSVRAIANRAGISTGSLRHHFPTQRELQDEVLTRVYDLALPGDGIHDSSVPARDRLVGCLRQVLVGVGLGAQARAATLRVVEEFVAPEPTEEVRAAYTAIAQQMQGRVEYWLAVLAKEGVLPEGDNARRAAFLLTVLNGLGMERALPVGESVLQTENDTLHLAVDCVLGAAAPQ